MGSHRPYGSGDQALSKRLDQKAFFKPEKLTTDERDTILDTYRRALDRVSENLQYLRSNLDTDPVALTFAADHGEMFGEEGFYFHQGQKRCVADAQTKVPVWFDGIDAEGPLGLVDIAPTIVDHVGRDPPDAWHGESRLDGPAEQALTIAPWHDQVTFAWQDFEKKIVARDATVELETDAGRSTASVADVDGELESQLRDLGYVDAG